MRTRGVIKELDQISNLNLNSYFKLIKRRSEDEPVAYIVEKQSFWNDDFKGTLYQTCRDMVELEDKFIDLAFNLGEVQGLKADYVKLYIF